jgi:hypothetical protein
VAPLVIDVKEAYGITQDGIAKAIEAAKKDFAARPNDTVILKFAAGTYALDNTSQSRGIIVVSGLQPGPQGRLIFQGAGMDQTTWVFASGSDWIYGRDAYRLSFVDMHMAGKDIDVSQGHVVEVGPGEVVLDIQRGFPTPLDIFDPNPKGGRYLRRYTDSRTDPQLIPDNNTQIPWKTTVALSGSLWQINLGRGFLNVTPPYHKGDLIGIKSAFAHGGGNNFWFFGGSDVTFDHIKWTGKSRGVFRGGMGKVQISNCVVERLPPIEGQTPSLATPSGGMQIGQTKGAPTLDDLVEGNHFEATGDDSIAFFNATGVIRNNFVADSFARGILLYHSPNTVVQNNTVLRCPILRQ